MPGMILLEPGNRILEECLSSQINAEAGSNTPADVRLCDFDDVSYRLVVEKDNLDLMKLSMNLPCYMQTEDFGGKNAVEKHYGSVIGTPETGFDLTLDVKLSEIKDKALMIKNLSRIKSNITGGVFNHFYSKMLNKEVPKEFKFDLRGDTTIYFLPKDDRVITVFSVDFGETVDRVLGNVFLDEFVAQGKKIGRAPPCTWSVNPPGELSKFGVTENEGCLGYFSFNIMSSHVEKGKIDSVIDVLQSFRTFLQYHIKCSKSLFHSKMRKRVRELIKVLNRAKQQDESKDKKTAGGKTFKRN